MAVHFDRWEKDPFFSAADEVQESADRMESTYRTWVHASRDTSDSLNPDELRRDLRTALGTAKWQLEEFERAVRCSYKKNAADEAKDRHRQFILAMEEKISVVENSLQKSLVSDGKISTQWVRLDEGERDELALFLSGPMFSGEKLDIRTVGNGDGHATPHETSTKPVSTTWKNSSYASELHLLGAKDVKPTGHRRTASASADIGSWNILVTEDKLTHDSSNGRADPPPRRVPSYSAFIDTMESVSKMKLHKNGFRKWKAADREHDDDIALLRSQELSRGTTACFEKSKSWLSAGDDCCDKQLYSWYGAVQRLLQRSQYQMQYSRPMQLTFWAALLVFSVFLFVLRAI